PTSNIAALHHSSQQYQTQTSGQHGYSQGVGQQSNSGAGQNSSVLSPSSILQSISNMITQQMMSQSMGNYLQQPQQQQQQQQQQLAQHQQMQPQSFQQLSANQQASSNSYSVDDEYQFNWSGNTSTNQTPQQSQQYFANS